MSEPQNKLPPRPRPRPALTGTGPRLTPKPEAAAKSDTAPKSNVALKSDPEAPTPLADSRPESIPPVKGTRLKIVTIDPGRASFADTEVPTAQRMAARKDPYMGATIDGRYRVEAVLGEGGMGVVYRCSHTIIGKKVAMKVLRPDLARDSEVTERFLNEAKAASAIGNPHIIDISDFGQFADGATYFIMEYLPGAPLSKAMDEARSLPLNRILHIARQLAEGLAAAHEAGIVHRDLKPDNIYLVDRGGHKDFVKILDFGIAKVSTTGEGRLTRAGAVFGTPHYMSPEQAAGAPVDHRGDVYSLGVILYEMASGRVPFDADNFMGILTQHMYKAPVPIRALVPQPAEVPPGLEAIVLKCLSKRPEDRYQTMSELIVDLDKLGSGQVPAAVNEMMGRSAGFNVPADYFKRGQMPAVLPATPVPLSRRNRWPLAAGIAGVAVAVALVVAIFAKSNASDARPVPSAAPAPLAKAEEQPRAPAPQEAAPRSAQEVMLAIRPQDAHVFLGERDLGRSPVKVAVPPDATVEVEIRAKGYKSATLTLDGSEPAKIVELHRAKSGSSARASSPAARKPSSAPAQKSSDLGVGIVDPWKH